MDELINGDQSNPQIPPEQADANVNAPHGSIANTVVNEPTLEAQEPAQTIQQATTGQTNGGSSSDEPNNRDDQEAGAGEQIQTREMNDHDLNEPELATQEPTTNQTGSEAIDGSRTGKSTEFVHLSDEVIDKTPNQTTRNESDNGAKLNGETANLTDKNENLASEKSSNEPEINTGNELPILEQIANKSEKNKNNFPSGPNTGLTSTQIATNNEQSAKIVEKIIIKEVPVEKIVEKIVIKEMPVEKIIEKEVIREVKVLDRDLFNAELKKASIQSLIQARTTKSRKNDLKKARLIRFIEERGSVSTKEIQLFLHISAMTAWRYTKKLINEGKIKSTGKRRARKYILS
jgi:hypothetical protein